MATAAPLMPKATAVWLLDNTALSFDQIAEFCKLHPLEVKAIADGDAAQGIKGLDPIVTGQLTREQIAEAEKNPEIAAEAHRTESRRSDNRAQQERPALYAGFASSGSPERHPLAGAQSSGTQRQCHHAPRWHHEVDDRLDPRSHALEFGQPYTDGPCDTRSRLADRPRPRSATRQQGKAGTGRHWRNAPSGRRNDGAQGNRSRRRAAEPEKKPAELDVSAVFAKLKQLGGKSEKDGE